MTGGTGFIGRALCSSLSKHGHCVTILTRNAREASRLMGTFSAVEWNAREGGVWEQALQNADAIVNLAGAAIADARWTEPRKKLLADSRVVATRLLVEALSRRASRPATLISASGIGYYGPSDDRVLDEGAAGGRGFLADLCREWEAEALKATALGIRVVLLRTGMVLEHEGGALPRMLLPFRLFAGGPIMPGTQWVSWIHRHDLVRLIEWALTNDQVSGPINAVAPSPVTMMAFCRALGRVLRRPCWFPVPESLVKLALGELGSVMTTGQRINPTKALSGGFAFHYPQLEPALRAILTEGD